MTPVEMMAHVGEALYGPRWRRSLARDAGVPEWQIRDWLTGKHDLPAAHPLFGTLAGLVEKRRVALSRAAGMIYGLRKVGT